MMGIPLSDLLKMLPSGKANVSSRGFRTATQRIISDTIDREDADWIPNLPHKSQTCLWKS